MEEEVLRDEILNWTGKLDERIAAYKRVIDYYSGKTRQELGDGLFNAVMKVANNAVRAMEYRQMLTIELQGKFGISII